MFGTTESSSALIALLLLPPLALSTVTRQNVTESVLDTGFPPCDALVSAGLEDRILLATSDAYEPRVQSWFSANGRFRPWCFVQPRNAQELSIAIGALADSDPGAGDWHIAVRSGGHSFPGSNNIANGVTIDLGMMNGSHYNPDTGLASVEPGAAWKDVYYNLLLNGNVTVTGGRDGGVGVGGYLLGGGISYYTGRNGFGCDEVINFELVLANGSIINANREENSALWKALKGGGLNFGIVTRFDIQAMPAVDLAYGQNVITSNYSDEVINAVVEFTNHPEELADDHLITLYTHDPRFSEEVTIILIRVNTQGHLNTTSFDKVNKIPSLTRSWDLKSLASAANDSQVAAGSKNAQRTLTFLNSPHTLRHAATLHASLVTTLSSALGAENFTTAVFFQPFPSYLSAISQRKGGNMLGLERVRSNAIMYVAGVGVTNGDDAALAVAMAELSAMVSRLEEFALREGAAVGFRYLNYADAGQDPLGSYGVENLGFMRGVAERYDPEGFWQRRVPGGFKLARAGAGAGAE